MRARLPLLIAAMVLLTAQAPKPAPKAPAAATAAFDARDPASLIALLATVQATATVTSRTEDAVLLKVTTPAYAFNADFAGCERSGRNCKALLLHTSSARSVGTLAELNGFNQSAIACKVFQDRTGKPHVTYAALVLAGDTRETMRAHLSAWQGCLASFGEFLADPQAYLAIAP